MYLYSICTYTSAQAHTHTHTCKVTMIAYANFFVQTKVTA